MKQAVQNQKGIFSISMGLILLIVIIIVATFYLVSQKNVSPDSIQQRTSQVIVSPSPPNKETTNWKTFQDPNYWISFDYPETWTLASYYGDKTILELSDSDKKPILNITFYENPQRLSLEELEKSLTKPCDYKGTCSPGIYEPNAKNVILNPGTEALYEEKAFCEPTICQKYIFQTDTKVARMIIFSQSNTQNVIIGKLLKSITLVK